MRRRLMMAAALVCGALALSTSPPARDAQRQRPLARDCHCLAYLPALVAQGHALFESSCASCHGSDRAGHPWPRPQPARRRRAGSRLLPGDRPDAAASTRRRSRCAPARRSRRARSRRSSPTSRRSAGPASPTVHPEPRVAGGRPAAVRTGLRGLPHDPGAGRDRDRRDRAVAERGDTDADRRGDADRPVRDAALRRRRALRQHR